MLPVVDKPLIQYAIEEARAAGIEQFCMVTGRGKTALVEHFDIAFELEATLRERGKSRAWNSCGVRRSSRDRWSTVRQQVPHGLGHAIWCARAFIGDDPFAILLPDDLVLADTPCLRQLADAYRDTGGNVVAVTEVPREQTNRYGILRIGKDDGRLVEVTGLVEKPEPKDAPSNLSIIGRYVLMPEVIEHLARMERGAGNEVQLTDGMAKLIGRQPFHGLRYEGQRFDCGDKIGFLEAQIALCAEAAGHGGCGASLPAALCRSATSTRSRRRLIMAFSHHFDPTTLREYDIRGIVGRTLHPERRLRHRALLRLDRRAGRADARRGGL